MNAPVSIIFILALFIFNLFQPKCRLSGLGPYPSLISTPPFEGAYLSCIAFMYGDFEQESLNAVTLRPLNIPENSDFFTLETIRVLYLVVLQ